MFKFLLRRHYIVDWKLQGSLVRHGLLYGALVLVVVILGMFAPLLWTLGGEAAPSVVDEQSVVMLYLHERFWPLALLSAAIVVFGAISFSHRIAGPLVRFKRNLRLLAEGKLAPALRTRPSDYLEEEVGCLNAAIAGVRERAEGARRTSATLQRRLRAIAEDPAAGVDAARIVELLTTCDELLTQLDGFCDVDPGDDDRRPAAAHAEPRPILVGRFE